MGRQRQVTRLGAILLALLLAPAGTRQAAAFVRGGPLIPTERLFPPGLIAAMMAVPVPNLDFHVSLVDATGAALGTAANPFFTAAGTNPGTQNVQGVLAPGATVSGVNPLLLGTIDSGNAVRFLLAAAAQTDAQAGINAYATGALGYNGSTYDRWRNNLDGVLQASAVTTAGTTNYDIANYNGRFIEIHYNVTLWNGGTLLVKVQMKDANGLFVDLPGATTGSITSTAGADVLINVGPASFPASASPNFYANITLPRTIRIVQTVSVASITLSGAYSLIN